MGAGQSTRKEQGAAPVYLLMHVEHDDHTVHLHVHDFNSEVQVRAFYRERELHQLQRSTSILPAPQDPRIDQLSFVGVAEANEMVIVDIHSKRSLEELIAERTQIYQHNASQEFSREWAPNMPNLRFVIGLA